MNLKVLKRLPNPTAGLRGPNRSVSMEQLLELLNFFLDFIGNRSAYYLTSNITKPFKKLLTKPYQLSYSELVGPGRLDFFVSHFWGTASVHFVESIEQHAKAKSASHKEYLAFRYWVCFLSNNQWHLEEEVGDGDWRESSFYKALRCGFCPATCMVLDQDALPLTRAWCLCEVLQTYRLEHDESIHNFEGGFFTAPTGVSSVTATGYASTSALPWPGGSRR